MARFERQPCVIARTAERYFELRADGIVAIGSNTKGALERWARNHGFAPTVTDERDKAAVLADMQEALARAERAEAAVSDLIGQGNRLAEWCCSLAGNATFDAVRCWNESRESARAAYREGGAK